MERRLFLKGLGLSSVLLGEVTTFDAFAKLKKHKREIDVIIVGSGPAGLSLADKLSANGAVVAVLESGDYNRNPQAQSLADISKVNPPPFDASFASQRIVGGSSLLWGGYCPRYQSCDFESKSKYGYGVDWPIPYSELEKYYCDAEEWLQVGTANAFTKCRNSFSSPYESSSDEWVKLLKSSKINKSIAASTCTNEQGNYEPLRLVNKRAPILRRRRNLRLFIDTTVRRIEFDQTGRATGVHVKRIKGQEGFIKAKVVVVAGGAVQNARLLQLSNSDLFPDAPGNASGQLGANFMEHPHIRYWVQPVKKYRKLDPTLLHLYDWYESNKKKGLGSLMLLLNRFERKPGWLKNKPEGSFFIDVLCEQEPRKENILTLDKYNKDLFRDPLPNIAYSFSKRDEETMNTSQKSIQNILNMFGGTIKKETGAFGAHLMGTTRMAKKDSEGVVDVNQRVFGTRNLYVTGSSVFPTGGASNPTLTLTALSLRLADHLLESAKQYGFSQSNSRTNKKINR